MYSEFYLINVLRLGMIIKEEENVYTNKLKELEQH